MPLLHSVSKINRSKVMKKRHFRGRRCRQGDNIKVDIKETAWVKFIWFRIGPNGWLSWTWSQTFGYHTKHWISQAKQLSDSFKTKCAEQISVPHTTSCCANKCNDERPPCAVFWWPQNYKHTNLIELLPHPECSVSHIMQEFLSVISRATGVATHSSHCAL
jgi:hypothetical protein